MNFWLSKRGLLLLSVIAVAAWVIGIVLSATSVQCVTQPATGQGAVACTSGPGGVIANVFYLIGTLVTAAVWVLGLVRTGASRQFGWFVLIFLTACVGTLLYGLFGPRDANIQQVRRQRQDLNRRVAS